MDQIIGDQVLESEGFSEVIHDIDEHGGSPGIHAAIGDAIPHLSKESRSSLGEDNSGSALPPTATESFLEDRILHTQRQELRQRERKRRRLEAKDLRLAKQQDADRTYQEEIRDMEEMICELELQRLRDLELLEGLRRMKDPTKRGEEIRRIDAELRHFDAIQEEMRRVKDALERGEEILRIEAKLDAIPPPPYSYLVRPETDKSIISRRRPPSPSHSASPPRGRSAECNPNSREEIELAEALRDSRRDGTPYYPSQMRAGMLTDHRRSWPMNVFKSVERGGAKVSPGAESTVDDTSSETSFGHESVFSVAGTATSNTNTSMAAGESDDVLIQELCTVLLEDSALLDLASFGLNDPNIGREKFQRNLRRLIKQFASDLRLEAIDQVQFRSATFIACWAGAVSKEICTRILGPKELQTLRKHDDDSTSESGSDTDELAGENEEYNLSQAKQFIRESFGFLTLRDNLKNFVQPTFQSKLKESLRVAKEESRRNNTQAGWIRNCSTEMQGIDPSTIQVDMDSSNSTANRAKVLIEELSGESWDWWPFAPAIYSLQGGRSLRWRCDCGEERRMEVPHEFAMRVKSLLRQFGNTMAAGNTPIGSNSVSECQSQQQQGGQSLPLPPTQAHVQSIKAISERHGFSEDPQTDPSRAIATVTSVSQPSPQWVLLVVRRGMGYHLAQIAVQNISSLEFFKKLRCEYFRLRGLWRYFSVWRYSHCDFYKFEKFDEFAYSPRWKDQYPDIRNVDYVYVPKPVRDMPPISEHEFYNRFYSTEPFKYLHPHPFNRSGGCKHSKAQRRGHCREIIHLLPKKLSQLDENSDQREFFWGMYAQEVVCLRWLLFWNVICISPLLWFFFMWLFRWGHSGDLQDASVPVTMVMGMLSLLWSAFLGSLKFGKR